MFIHLSLTNMLTNLHRAIYQYLGYVFVKIQKWLFASFILAILAKAPYMYLVEDKVFTEITGQIYRSLYWWVFLSSASSLIWLVIRNLFNIDLWIYYYFWVRKVVPMFGVYLYNESELSMIKLINESFQSEKGEPICPVFVKRAHLERRSFWPHWEFAIVVAFQPGKFRK